MHSKRAVYGSAKCDESSSEGEDREEEHKQNTRGGIKEENWLKPKNDEVKLIDFGGATFENDHHTAIINTR